MLMVGSVNFKANYSAISFGEKEVYTGPDDLKLVYAASVGKDIQR